MSIDRCYYVYALKDPLLNPSSIFYIGKGTGSRAWDHDLAPDKSSKGLRISAIQNAGREVLISKLVDDLTEIEALRIEAELISALGTEGTGGPLTNAVSPSLNPSVRALKNINVPSGAVEKAQLGLELLKTAVFELAAANGLGVKNHEVAKSLGLQSDYRGGSKDYLSFSILGLLMRDGRILLDERRHKAKVR